MNSEVSLANVCSLIVDCPHNTAPESEDVYAFAVGTKAISEGRIDFTRARAVNAATYERWIARATPTEGDLILCREAPVGPVAQVPSSPRVCLGQRTVLLRPDPVVADPRFVFYSLLAPRSQAALQVLSEGSTVPHLNVADVRGFRIAIPDLDEQIRIARVLGALDDKIDSNRRLAGLLEETTATLFRGRFVDLVGVEEFDDSETGRIPRGWKPGSLLDLAEFVNGRAFTKHASGEGRPILRIRELNGGVDAQTLRAAIDANAANVAQFNDILFAWSGSLGVYRWPGQESLINQHIFKVIPTGVPPWFAHLWVAEFMASFRSIAAEKATTMGHIQRRHLAEARLAVPPPQVLQQADAVIRPLDEQRASLVRERQTLASIRDALLPRLISGELEVPDTVDVSEVVEPLVEDFVAP